MTAKIILILSFVLLCAGCSGTKVYIDSSSESSIEKLNQEIQTFKTSVYLNDGTELRDGTFELNADSITHIIESDTIKYAISDIEMIKTVGDHKDTSVIGIGLIGGAFILYTSFTKDDDNDEFSNSGFVSRDFNGIEGTLYGSILGVVGIVILATGIAKATTKYYF